MEYALGHKPPQKKKKGRKKECGSCNELVAISKRVCNCGFVFYEKKESKPPRKHYEVDFLDISEGDSVYIMAGDFWRSPEGENIGMSEPGTFDVIKITEQGVLAHNKYGYTFFDIVNEGYNPKTGITRGKIRFFKRGSNPKSKG